MQSSMLKGHFFPHSELPVDTLIWIQLYAVNENAICIVIPAAFLIHSENMDKRRIGFLMTLFMPTCRSNKKSPDLAMLLCLFRSILSKAKGH